MNTSNEARHSRNFLTETELTEEYASGNTLLDTCSLLISAGVQLGRDNIFYPNVVIELSADGVIIIGNNNTFYPGTYILSSQGGIRIGDGNEFGTGGCTIKANMADANITVGNHGRYCDNTSIMGKTSLGDGSQVLGSITVQGCQLEGGGNHTEPDPDERGAVLKGFGLARGLHVLTGQVMNGFGNFADAPIEWQRAYHPKK